MKDELNYIFSFDFLHQSLKQLFLFLMELTATFISGPASLLNNDPKNPPDWIILEIWALESFKSANILLLNAFLRFVFCLVVKNNSWGTSFSSNIFQFILRVVPVVYSTVFFSFFSCVSVNFMFTLLYSTIYTIYTTFVVPLKNCSIVSFDFFCNKLLLLYLLLLILFYQ